MELGLLKKLQEIIIDYAEYLYRETIQSVEADDCADYYYDGPIFAFKVDREQLCLVNNTQTAFEGGLISIVEPGDFIRPRSNQIKAAFLKYRYWENKIHAAHKKSRFTEASKTELQIVKTKLMAFATQMLKALAESYSIRIPVGPIRRHYPAMPDSIRDPEEGPYRQLPACEIRVWSGTTLQITNDPPADLQLKIEEFNDLLHEADKEIKRIQETEIERIEKENNNPSKQIISLLPGKDQLGEEQDHFHKVEILEPAPGALEGNGEQAKPIVKPLERAEIVNKIMKYPRDFNDREKVEQLAKELDANSTQMIFFRVRNASGAEIKLKDSPPKTYSEVAKNKKQIAYKRIFDPQKGSLVKDLYKK
jgi:hypothetical protein